jgi:hypothetical protein
MAAAGAAAAASCSCASPPHGAQPRVRVAGAEPEELGWRVTPEVRRLLRAIHAVLPIHGRRAASYATIRATFHSDRRLGPRRGQGAAATCCPIYGVPTHCARLLEESTLVGDHLTHGSPTPLRCGVRGTWVWRCACPGSAAWRPRQQYGMPEKLSSVRGNVEDGANQPSCFRPLCNNFWPTGTKYVL